MVTRPKQINLSVHEFGADLEDGNLVWRTKTRD